MSSFRRCINSFILLLSICQIYSVFSVLPTPHTKTRSRVLIDYAITSIRDFYKCEIACDHADLYLVSDLVCDIHFTGKTEQLEAIQVL